MIVKEFVQMRRDRMTFATMIFVPILQLTLFGYAINTDPKHMPTVVADPRFRALDPRRARRAREHGLFRLQAAGARSRGDGQADPLGKSAIRHRDPGELRARRRRGDRPAILVIADATDPVATGTAISAVQGVVDTALRRELRGPDAAVRARLSRSRSRYSAATIRKASPNTISCPACSASCSP